MKAAIRYRASSRAGERWTMEGGKERERVEGRGAERRGEEGDEKQKGLWVFS